MRRSTAKQKGFLRRRGNTSQAVRKRRKLSVLSRWLRTIGPATLNRESVSGQSTSAKDPYALNYLNRLDDHLTAVTELLPPDANLPYFRLRTNLHYDTQYMGTLYFNLHNYTETECVELAKSVASNEFLMREIDFYLASDIE